MSPASCAVLAGVLIAASAAHAQAPTAKAEIVAVTGCLKEAPPGTWTLVDASDPVISVANAPSARELSSLPKSGKKRFRLIGVSVFNLPAHREHTIAVKGIRVDAAPMSRLNVTSVTMVASTCPPPEQK